MTSSSINTLGLALLLVTAPALQANDTENSSWLAPFSSKTFLYPAIGIGTGYVLYKLYTNYSQSSDIDVIAPWYEEERTIEAPAIAPEQVTHEITTIDLMTLDALQDVIQSCVTLFVEASGPQLVTIHLELENPELTEEDRTELEEIRAELENQAPPFSQTVPPLMVGLALLDVAQKELIEEARSQNLNKGTVNTEYESLLNMIDSLNFFMRTFVEIYGETCQADLMNEYSEQLQKESYEHTQTCID